MLDTSQLGKIKCYSSGSQSPVGSKGRGQAINATRQVVVGELQEIFNPVLRGGKNVLYKGYELNVEE